MNKLVGFAAGTLAVGSMALITAGHASSTGPVDTSGQTYGQAAAELTQQGYHVMFGGSVGGDVPQSKCIVTGQKVLNNGWVSLTANCTKAAQPPPGSQSPAGQPAGKPGQPGLPGAPNVGSNGTTTVTPTPVGPQPGMNIPGM